MKAPWVSPPLAPDSRPSCLYVFCDPAAALAFFGDALRAMAVSRHLDAAGQVRRAEMRIGDFTFMMSAANPDFAFMRRVQQIGGSPVQFFL